MKALTLWQPWASLIAAGDKRTETRSWSTIYRGPLAIHAAASSPAWAGGLMLEVPFNRSNLSMRTYPVLPAGKVLAVVHLVDVVIIDEHYYVAEPERSYGDYTPGRYAWHLDNISMLPEPVPAHGSQGLWNWTAPAQLEELLRR